MEVSPRIDQLHAKDRQWSRPYILVLSASIYSSNNANYIGQITTNHIHVKHYISVLDALSLHKPNRAHTSCALHRVQYTTPLKSLTINAKRKLGMKCNVKHEEIWNEM